MEATPFPEYLSAQRAKIEGALEQLLPRPHGPAAELHKSMRYAVLAGGKRLRPAIVIAACEAAGADAALALEPAAAVELIHSYSLVHDDLPAMDDDDLRRGQPTVHRQFGEAQAILCGDALLTLGFEILGRFPEGQDYATRRAEAVVLVARDSGANGMVGGQLADCEGVAVDDAERLRWIHCHKTGALFAASVELGAIVAGADHECRRRMREFGSAVGLAFQIADDLLDSIGSAAELGKTPGKDARSGKTTFSSLYGVEASRAEAERIVAEAAGSLKEVGPWSPVLAALGRFAVDRTR
jgi:geranylgeranyl pyrophosphate synthase